jgi:polysaccharide biosynthesis/export protein
MNRFAFATALLFISSACLAQTSVQGNAASPDGRANPLRPAVASPEPPQATTVPPAVGDPSATQTPVFSLGKEYRIGSNDLLEIEILNLDTAKRTVRVNAVGAITMPLIGGVIVAGLTQQEAETHLASLYGEKYLQDPQVSVFIKEFTTERITVDGAVVKPGIYPLVGQMTLLRALALAGGFGQIANTTEVKLFRRGENGNRHASTFDVEKIRAGKGEDPEVRGDDLIVVQRNSTRALLKDSVLRDVLDYLNPFSIFAR